MCLKIEICDIAGYCHGQAGTDPYRNLVETSDVVCGGFTGRSLLDQFRRDTYTFGRKPSSLSQCDTVHFIYGKNRFGERPFVNEIVGCAYTGALCTTFGIGLDYFGYTTNEHLHSVLLAHEVIGLGRML